MTTLRNHPDLLNYQCRLAVAPNADSDCDTDADSVISLTALLDAHGSIEFINLPDMDGLNHSMWCHYSWLRQSGLVPLEEAWKLQEILKALLQVLYVFPAHDCIYEGFRKCLVRMRDPEDPSSSNGLPEAISQSFVDDAKANRQVTPWLPGSVNLFEPFMLSLPTEVLIACFP